MSAHDTLLIPGQDPGQFRASPGMAYVYAVTDDGFRHKIGMATDMKRRMSNLQTSNSARLILTDILEVAKGRERILERTLHRDLGYRRLRGEWFGISAVDVKTLFTFARIRWVDDPNLDL